MVDIMADIIFYDDFKENISNLLITDYDKSNDYIFTYDWPIDYNITSDNAVITHCYYDISSIIYLKRDYSTNNNHTD